MLLYLCIITATLCTCPRLGSPIEQETISYPCSGKGKRPCGPPNLHTTLLRPALGQWQVTVIVSPWMASHLGPKERPPDSLPFLAVLKLSEAG